jgi:quercetin dioxygenase-like cupin family protein
MNAYHLTPDLYDLVKDIPPDTIVSRTFYKDDRISAILFGFAPGQELSEHTSTQTAILHILQGEADLTLGSDARPAQAGTWVHMPPQLPHSVRAKTAVVMLLIMIKGTV